MSHEDEATKQTHKASLSGTAAIIIGGQVKATIHAPLPAGHPMNPFIGQVASSYSHVEHLLDLCIWELLGTDPRVGACVTSQLMGIPSRCKTLIALLKVRKVSADLENKIVELMNKSYAVADERNRIVHDPFYVDKESNEAGQFKSMSHKDWRYGIEPITEEAVQKTLERIKGLRDKAAAIRNAILEKRAT